MDCLCWPSTFLAGPAVLTLNLFQDPQLCSAIYTAGLFQPHIRPHVEAPTKHIHCGSVWQHYSTVILSRWWSRAGKPCEAIGTLHLCKRLPCDRALEGEWYTAFLERTLGPGEALCIQDPCIVVKAPQRIFSTI